MITDKEREFMQYWEASREEEKKLSRQLLRGIPMGLLFAVPILVILFTGRFWYIRAEAVAQTMVNPLVLILAVTLIVIFMAVFYKKHQWERKEEYYQHLKARQKKSEADQEEKQLS